MYFGTDVWKLAVRSSLADRTTHIECVGVVSECDHVTVAVGRLATVGEAWVI